MTDLWAFLTRGRVVSRETLRRETAVAWDDGWADGTKAAHVTARLARAYKAGRKAGLDEARVNQRLAYFATSQASDNVAVTDAVNSSGMAVWDDERRA